MDMRTFLSRKLLYLVITLFAIIAFNFFLFRIMPGDPEKVLAPKTGDPVVVEIIRAKFGLDRPLYEQLGLYIVQVFTLDFGISLSVTKGAAISDLLGPAVINTVLLVGIGTALAIWWGVLLGRAAAWRRGKFADTVGMAFALTFYSMPTFLFALVMLMVFAGNLGWFPIAGPYDSERYPNMDLLGKIGDRAYHLVLPVLAFTIEVMAEYALIMRNSLTDVLTEDYIITARAKGLSNKAILRDHAMRNALLPVVTVAAISVGWVIGGDIMVEIVFNYKGIGLLTWEAVYNRDFPVLQAVFLIMAIAVLVANLFADIIYMYLDPRVKI